MTDSDGDLHPEVASIIGALIASAGATAVLPTDTLVKIACGLSTEDEMELGVSALTESSFLRERLLSLRVIVKRQMSAPLTQVTQASPDELAVAECLREGLAESVGTYERLHDRSSSLDWNAILTPLDLKARAVRLALQSVGATIRALATGPSFAEVRSDGPQRDPVSTEIELRKGIIAQLTNTWNDGTLTASVDLDGDISAILGQVLHLEIEDPAGGSVPIDSAPIEGPSWRLEVPDLTEVLNARPQDINIRVSLDEPGSQAKSLLIATVPGSSSIFPLPVTAPARVVNGQLLVEIVLPIEARASFADRELAVAIALGTAAQTVGAWPVSDWGSSPRLIEVPLPGVPDGVLSCHSVLSATFR